MQPPPLSLRRNFSWTFLGNTIYAASQWGMLVVLAKLGTPAMVGQLTLGLAVTAPIFMLTNLQLGVVQATDTQEQYHFSDYLGLRLLGSAIALLLLLGVILLAGYRGQIALIILIIGVAKALESISDIFYGLFQQQERMDHVAKSMMWRGGLALLCFSFGVYRTSSVMGGATGLAIAWLLVLVWHDLHQGRLILKSVLPWDIAASRDGFVWVGAVATSKFISPMTNPVLPRWQLKTIVNLVRLVLPLGMVMMLISLNANIPRFFIQQYWGETELGIFSALAAFMVLGSMIVGALGQSAIARLAKYYANPNHQGFFLLLLKLIGIAILIGGSGIVLTVLLGKQLLLLFYQPTYADRLDVLLWLMVAAGLGYISSFLGYALTATRAFNYLILPYLAITAIAVGFSYLWIPPYGLVGAAWAVSAANLANCMMPLLILAILKSSKK